jgi:hypothetical protein
MIKQANEYTVAKIRHLRPEGGHANSYLASFSAVSFSAYFNNLDS